MNKPHVHAEPIKAWADGAVIELENKSQDMARTIMEMGEVIKLLREWDVDATSLYDEEGIEGWRWSKGDREYYSIGDWSELPTIPDELKESDNG